MICRASFRSSQKSLQLPHRPLGSIDLGRVDPIAAGSCNRGVRNDETAQTPSINLMKLRNERRRFKNISIYVTELPVTPFLHRVQIPGGEKKPAEPPVPDYIRPHGGSISPLLKQPYRPRSPTPAQQFFGYRRSDVASFPNRNPSMGRHVASGIIVQSGRNSDVQPYLGQYRVPKFDRSTEFYDFNFQRLENRHKEEFNKLSSVMKERIIDRQIKLEHKLKIYQANWLAERWLAERSKRQTEQLSIDDEATEGLRVGTTSHISTM